MKLIEFKNKFKIELLLEKFFKVNINYFSKNIEDYYTYFGYIMSLNNLIKIIN